MEKKNQDIRKELARNGIPLWLIGKAFGVSEGTMVRWMREEMTDTKKAEIREVIKQLITERAN